MTPRGRRISLLTYRKPFGGPADPVKKLDPIQTLFWPKGIGSEIRRIYLKRKGFGDEFRRIYLKRTGFGAQDPGARRARRRTGGAAYILKTQGFWGRTRVRRVCLKRRGFGDECAFVAYT